MPCVGALGRLFILLFFAFGFWLLVFDLCFSLFAVCFLLVTFAFCIRLLAFCSLFFAFPVFVWSAPPGWPRFVFCWLLLIFLYF